jgi:hypothetical protein
MDPKLRGDVRGARGERGADRSYFWIFGLKKRTASEFGDVENGRDDMNPHLINWRASESHPFNNL